MAALTLSAAELWRGRQISVDSAARAPAAANQLHVAAA